MFYTYLWLRYDGSPYYVGKGKGHRAFYSDGHTVRRPKDDARILIQYHESEADAITAEIFLIVFYGRLDLGTGCLRNRTDGGDGISGYKFDSETVARVTNKLKGRKRSDAFRKKISIATTKERNPFFGRKHSIETKKILSEKCGHVPWNTGTKGLVGKWNIGLVRSAEANEKNRLAHLGKKLSEEHREKISAAIALHWEKRRGFAAGRSISSMR